MPRKKKPPLTFVEQMQKLVAANLDGNKPISSRNTSIDDNAIDSLDTRVKKILGLTTQTQKTAGNMLFFVMYDIESNKVRRLVAKYLLNKGCSRIQHSIFLADTPIDTYNSIKDDLAQVQAAYDNNDSIIVLPVTTDYLRMMKIIGKNIEVDVITHSRNTLFF